MVEKRDRFSRNNVLHLWPYTIVDLKSLGAKMFYGKFCAGAIDHISIRQLQCVLLKAALLLGVHVNFSASFEGLVEPSASGDAGWRVRLLPEEHPIAARDFDVVIGADGRRNTLPGSWFRCLFLILYYLKDGNLKFLSIFSVYFLSQFIMSS